jgi:hypothetical protein
MSTPDWMSDAACARIPHLPWTTDTHRAPDVLVDIMREVCAACPVAAACAAYVDTASITGGWWAGEDRDPEAIWHRIEWVPVLGRKGRLLAEQAALPLDLAVAA